MISRNLAGSTYVSTSPLGNNDNSSPGNSATFTVTVENEGGGNGTIAADERIYFEDFARTFAVFRPIDSKTPSYAVNSREAKV